MYVIERQSWILNVWPIVMLFPVPFHALVLSNDCGARRFGLTRAARRVCVWWSLLVDLILQSYICLLRKAFLEVNCPRTSSGLVYSPRTHPRPNNFFWQRSQIARLTPAVAYAVGVNICQLLISFIDVLLIWYSFQQLNLLCLPRTTWHFGHLW